jgi:hypothetical protein
MLEVSMRYVIAFALMASAALLTGCTDQVGVTCPPGQTLCGETCVYTSSDPHNCGSCGNDCGDLVCIGGTCGCPKGQTACNGECVNTANDVANCGACGTTCPMPQVCSMGMCSGSCAAGLTNCNRDCVDLSSDDKNCGMCGAACASGTHCQGGSCVQECPAGQVVCNGKCVSLSSDNSNCGACGNVCPNDYFCIFGSCILGCPKPLTRCVPDGGESDGGSQCIDTRFDPNNCGGCGGSDVSPAPIPSQPPTRPHVCTATAGFNDDPVCDNGRCDWVCAAGMLDCDQSQARGARIYSPNGGNPPPPNVGAIEEACVNPTNDNCNCGGCGISCVSDDQDGDNWSQQGGGPNACVPFLFDVSAPSQACCDSTCSVVGDVNSCGNCAGVSDCTAGVPIPSSPACCPKDLNHPENNDNFCSDLSADLHNCGSCGLDCTGPSAPPGNDTCCPNPNPSLAPRCAKTAVSVNHCGNGCNTAYTDCTVVPSGAPVPSTPACCAGVNPSIPPKGFGCFDVTDPGNFLDATHIHNCGACGTDCTVTNPCPSNNPNPICRSGVCDCTGS